MTALTIICIVMQPRQIDTPPAARRSPLGENLSAVFRQLSGFRPVIYCRAKQTQTQILKQASLRKTASA